MINYITRNKEGVFCSHPKVEKYWEWGGCSATPGSKVFHCSSINMKNGDKKDFKSEGDNWMKSIEGCNEYLNTIPE